MPKRTVSFHYLCVNREENIPGTITARRRALSCREIEGIFTEIYETMTQLQTGTRIQTVVTLYNQYFVEVLSFVNHIAFIRIGQQNPNNTYGIRDIDTLERSEVPMRANQLLELYTYCLVDFSNCIISYIGVNGAPKISALRYLIDDHFEQREHTTAYIAAIMTEDIVDTIVRKDVISALSIKVAVPSDEVLRVIGVNENTFDTLRNVRMSSKSIEIVARRKKNLIGDRDDLTAMLNSTKERYGDDLRGFEVKAHDNGEENVVYNLLHYHFTRKVELQDERDHDTLTSDTFREALGTTYEANRDELLRYTPTAR